MGLGYAIILNNFMSKDTDTTEKDIMNNINILLTTLTDVYVVILEKGIVAVEGENIQFRSDYTKEFFIAGLTGLKQALMPSTLKSLLDFLFIQKSREGNISAADLFEMHLLTEIIPNLLPEGDSIKKYIDYLVEFCTGNTQHFQIAKFVKYINVYKITDCNVLELIRSIETKRSTGKQVPQDWQP
jgi:hypothetical protein